MDLARSDVNSDLCRAHDDEILGEELTPLTKGCTRDGFAIKLQAHHIFGGAQTTPKY